MTPLNSGVLRWSIELSPGFANWFSKSRLSSVAPGKRFGFTAH